MKTMKISHKDSYGEVIKLNDMVIVSYPSGSSVVHEITSNDFLEYFIGFIKDKRLLTKVV